MSVDPTIWDPSSYLDDNESISAYINEAIKDGDPKLITAAIGDVARSFGMTQLAKVADISREALYRALSDKGNPEFATVLAALSALNLTLQVAPRPSYSTNLADRDRQPADNLHTYSIFSEKPAPYPSINIELYPFATVKGENINAKRPHIGPTGPVSSARIYPQIRDSSVAPVGSSFEHAGSVSPDAPQLNR